MLSSFKKYQYSPFQKLYSKPLYSIPPPFFEACNRLTIDNTKNKNKIK